MIYLGIEIVIVLNGFLGAMGKDVYDLFKEKYGWFKEKIKDRVCRKLKRDL